MGSPVQEESAAQNEERVDGKNVHPIVNVLVLTAVVLILVGMLFPDPFAPVRTEYRCWTSYRCSPRTADRFFKLLGSGTAEEVAAALEKHPRLLNATTSYRSKYPWSALTTTVEAENTAVVKLLLQRGADVHDDLSPLFTAAHGQSAEIVDLLCQHGADVNAVGGGEVTPLFCSVMDQLYALGPGSPEVQEALRRHGAQMTKLEQLHYYSATGDTAKVGAILTANPELANRELLEHTPMFWAIIHGHMGVVRQLVSAGADVNHRDPDRGTPLSRVISNNDECLDMVRYLIAQGADVNKGSYDGSGPLHKAAEKGDAAVAAALMANGADINAVQIGDVTALHLAAQAGYSAVTALLISKGARINAIAYPQATPSTPLDLALSESHLETAKLLKSLGGQTAAEALHNSP